MDNSILCGLGIRIQWAGTWRRLGDDKQALFVSSSSNGLAVMLEKALCVKGFARDGEGLAKWGEVERNRFVV